MKKTTPLSVVLLLYFLQQKVQSPPSTFLAIEHGMVSLLNVMKGTLKWIGTDASYLCVLKSDKTFDFK